MLMRKGKQMNDCISRQDVLKLVDKGWLISNGNYQKVRKMVESLPSAEPTLYGYKIEHLVYIAKVMEKEGVTADYAVRTFNDMSRVIKMIIDEIQKKVEETLDERFNQQTGGN